MANTTSAKKAAEFDTAFGAISPSFLALPAPLALLWAGNPFS